MILVCVVGLACVALISIGLGASPVPWSSIGPILLRESGLRPDAAAGVSVAERAIVWHIRLPRVLVGGLVGGSLALSGALLQGLLRNPMASPGVIGVSSGAALGASVAISLGLGLVSIWAVPLFAFAGALGSAGLVYALASRGGRTQIATLILCGIAVNATAASLTSFLLSMQAQEWEVARQILFWLMGGLTNRTWEHVVVIAPSIGLCALVASFLPRELNLIAMGEESALALGVDVARVKRLTLAIAAGAAGAAVSVAGAIGFVGLVVPHVMRLLVGPDHRRLFAASLLGGALFLTAMDLIVRLLPGGEELRVGALTCGLGGPFFLALVLRHRRRGELP